MSYLGVVVRSTSVISWSVSSKVDHLIPQLRVEHVVELREVLSVTAKYSVFVLYLNSYC